MVEAMLVVGLLAVLAVAGAVGTGAAYLARRGGAAYPHAASAAASAFGATVTLLAAVAVAVTAIWALAR